MDDTYADLNIYDRMDVCITWQICMLHVFTYERIICMYIIYACRERKRVELVGEKEMNAFYSIRPLCMNTKHILYSSHENFN